MYIHLTKPLFAWDCLEDSPSLRTVRQALAMLPDGKLLESLRRARGKGRDDYPVEVLWGVVVLTALLRHPGVEACLGELGRNAGLRQAIGIESEAGVPKKWNVSRFLETLGRDPHRTLLHAMFDAMVGRLGAIVPDLGESSAGDATALNARRRSDAGAQEEAHEGLAPPSGGRKEYTDDEGKVVKVLEWFGYKLHLLVDVQHEVALAYAVTAAHAGDGETLPALVQEAQANLPADRLRTLAYDKAADSNDVHALLKEAGIRPLIQMRALWKDEHERLLPGQDAPSNIVYDEAGTVYCYDMESRPAIRHPMAYIGHEPQRGTLKYRCPARHEGWPCPNENACNAGKTYGRTVRLKCELDLRRFPPIPRATKQFERLYKGRTAVERVNARVKIFWGADDGNLAGARRFHAFVGVVMVVHEALATLLAATPRRQGPLGKMHLGPIQKALERGLAP
jgi:hypothetical protein